MGASPTIATNMFNLKKIRKMEKKVFENSEQRKSFNSAIEKIAKEGRTLSQICKSFALTEGANKEVQDRVFKESNLPDSLKNEFVNIATDKKQLMNLMKGYLLRADGVFVKKYTFTKISGGEIKISKECPKESISFKSLKKQGFRGAIMEYQTEVQKLTNRNEQEGYLECFCYIPKESYSFGEIWSAIKAYFGSNKPDLMELETRIQNAFAPSEETAIKPTKEAEKPVSLDSRTAEDLVKGYIDRLSDANKKKITKYNYLCVRIGKTGVPVIGFTNKPVKASGVVNFETSKYRTNVQG